MKKILFLLFFTHLSIAAFCQTVTIIDLKQLSKGEDADKILVSKSYQVVETKHPKGPKQMLYVINNHTPKAEFVQIKPGVTAKDGKLLYDVSYMARDTNYVNRIMKQVNMSGMELTDKKLQKSQIAYTFDSKKLVVMVAIKKHITLQSTVQIHPKVQ